MGKEQARSRNGHSIFEISSLIQKALRRSDARMALYSAAEMLPKYRNYLWKRLLTVSTEDCHDMVTHKVVALHDKDRCGANGYDNSIIEEALSILLNASKNRDGDYYACNIFNSRDKRNLEDKYGIENFDPLSATKNGHNCYYLRDVFNRAIDILDYDNAGYAANEIKVYYPKFCWDMIVSKAVSLGYPQLTKEVVALKEADHFTSYDNTLLFRSKAIVLMLKAVKDGGISNLLDDDIRDEYVSLSDADVERLRLPEYVYDCHTYIGKARGKTKREFVVTEQNVLTPFKKGMFDNASWERFFYMCANGFWTKEYTPHPGEERIKEIENNQPKSLFDL
ncbi:MAG: hypothetical protein HDS62_08465 [Bacteroidales bacterium]|nr:hypothetical protein [Bacteroidales bacterium]